MKNPPKEKAPQLDGKEGASRLNELEAYCRACVLLSTFNVWLLTLLFILFLEGGK